MSLEFVKTIEDARGKIVIYSMGNMTINLVEIKKGFLRGGHYHQVDTDHQIISGKIKLTTKDMDTGEEKSEIVEGSKNIPIKAEVVHLFEALEDTVFMEAFDGEYEATNYPEFRKLVEDKMNEK